MVLLPCCATGFKHDGELSGEFKDFHGTKTYFAGKPSDKIVLLLTDILGLEYKGSLLLADQFAEEGFFVVVPDLFNNDPVALNPPEGFSLMDDWFPRHTFESTIPFAKEVAQHIKDDFKPSFVGTVGYCYGGKLVGALGATDLVNALAWAHPSFVTVEDAKAIKHPLIIAAAETDNIYTPELRSNVEAALKETGKTYYATLSSKTVHGFACRGDPNDPPVKFAKEKAFADFTQWFKLHGGK